MPLLSRLIFTWIFCAPILALSQIQSLDNWQFAQREFGGMWDVWREISYEGEVWKPVSIPHCFNAEDAVDPDVKYYQGEGWYKTALEINNPYLNGRTRLHF
ncbi:MAG: glycoside hydrolase family 2, partial [Bacteroidota bacterium]